MSDDTDFAAVVELLNDEYVRIIMAETSVEPLSASELTNRCDASQQTIYRRLERLQAAGLVEDRTRVRKDGHHDTVYAALFHGFSVTLQDGVFEFELDKKTGRDAADELTDLWRKF